MQHTTAAFFDFRDVIRSLHGLPEAQQLHKLKWELFGAFERAADFQARARELELKLARAEDERVRREHDHQEFAERMARDAVAAKRLSDDKLEAMRHKHSANQTRCEELQRLCGALLEILQDGDNTPCACQESLAQASAAPAASC
jgi:hypothetical protein